jgi:hypothetical protein
VQYLIIITCKITAAINRIELTVKPHVKNAKVFTPLVVSWTARGIKAIDKIYRHIMTIQEIILISQINLVLKIFLL